MNDRKVKGNVPSKKKLVYPVLKPLEDYLYAFNRSVPLPLQYQDLLQYDTSIPLLNQKGEDTLWETVYFMGSHQESIHEALTNIYALLKADGDIEVTKHLSVARIDYCTFGNSKPFRIRIINRFNDNYDHFYVKRADASRIYGLELEYLLSPNNLMYLIDQNTLIEEHVAGIPGDDFIEHNLKTSTFNQIRIAKEFIKFNERCFVRLLGDMRSYNYVVRLTPDIEGNQYRIRAIDFDQQSYEGWKSFYLPQYFKENNPIIFLGIQHMAPQTVRQYQLEERSLIATRFMAARHRVERLFRIMVSDQISTPSKVDQLKVDLANHHYSNAFEKCETMGDIVFTNVKLLLQKDFK
ncbi:MAG: hypothetical protein HRU40_21285, partial [Saprospiraceae bacterium]|nr:hypothetical protein [Saprospiraceae bacterium]